MLMFTKMLAVFSLIWAAVALLFQVARARGAGRVDYSHRRGVPLRGVLYNFTSGMSPKHKESVRRHPMLFAVGLVMHTGVFLALFVTLVLIMDARSGAALRYWLQPLLWVALAAGLFLLLRRCLTLNLRYMSTPDDFVAILASCGLLIFASFSTLDAAGQTALFLYAAAFLLYLPLGKLRHFIFFFAARADYGRRLGYRGVYPPAAASGE